jgi:hypothetical protein
MSGSRIRVSGAWLQGLGSGYLTLNSRDTFVCLCFDYIMDLTKVKAKEGKRKKLKGKTRAKF